MRIEKQKGKRKNNGLKAFGGHVQTQVILSLKTCSFDDLFWYLLVVQLRFSHAVFALRKQCVSERNQKYETLSNYYFQFQFLNFFLNFNENHISKYLNVFH